MIFLVVLNKVSLASHTSQSRKEGSGDHMYSDLFYWNAIIGSYCINSYMKLRNSEPHNHTVTLLILPRSVNSHDVLLNVRLVHVVTNIYDIMPSTLSGKSDWSHTKSLC